MSRLLVVALALVFSVPAARSSAQTLTAQERAFIDQHISTLVRIEPRRLADPAVQSVFAVPLYSVKMSIGPADSEGVTSVTAARVGSDLALVSLPSADGNVPDLQKMLNPSFRVASAADAKTLQDALDAAYPDFSMSDDKGPKYRRVGNRWVFKRGAFGENQFGFIFEIGPGGAITAVKYSMKLPK